MCFFQVFSKPQLRWPQEKNFYGYATLLERERASGRSHLTGFESQTLLPCNIRAPDDHLFLRFLPQDDLKATENKKKVMRHLGDDFLK